MAVIVSNACINEIFILMEFPSKWMRMSNLFLFISLKSVNTFQIKVTIDLLLDTLAELLFGLLVNPILELLLSALWLLTKFKDSVF